MNINQSKFEELSECETRKIDGGGKFTNLVKTGYRIYQAGKLIVKTSPSTGKIDRQYKHGSPAHKF